MLDPHSMQRPGDVLACGATADDDDVELLHVAPPRYPQCRRWRGALHLVQRSENGAMSKMLGNRHRGHRHQGSPVDTETGELVADRHRIVTPQPATPEAVAKVVGEVAAFFDWKEPAGATFPAVIKNGVAYTAANVDKSWIGTDAGKLFSDAIGAPGHGAQRRRRRRRRRDGVRRGEGRARAS